MRLSIETDAGIIFKLEDESALVPSAYDERATVFEALSQALSILSQSPTFEGKAVDCASKVNINAKRSGHSYGEVVPFRRP